MKMNRKKLLILTGISLIAVTNLFAGNNEKGIEYYRADLFGAAKLFFLQQKNQSAAEQAENFYYLGQTYYQLNQEDSASYYFRKAIELFPTYPFGYVGEGLLQLTRKNAKAADELFKKANNLAKKDPSVQTAIAEAYIQVGDYGNAIIALDRARRINSKFSGIYVAEGDMFMKQGKIGDASGRYDNAILFNPSDKVAYLNQARIYKDVNPALAITFLDRLIGIDPNYIPAYAIYGDIYWEGRQYKNAVDAFEKFITIPGVPLEHHERYAHLLYFTNQTEKALEQFKYVLSQDPNNLVIKRLEAYNSLRLENFSLGLEQMNQFLKEMPKERHIWNDYTTLGQLAMKERQPAVALEAFQKAIDMDPEKSGVFYKEMAAAATGLGKHKDAIAYYEKYFIADPSADANDYYNYANAVYQVATNYIMPESIAKVTTPEAIAAYESEFKSLVQKGDKAYAEVVKRRPEVYFGYTGRANIHSLLDSYEIAKTEKMTGHAKPFYEAALPVLLNTNEEGSKNRFIIEAYSYLGSYYFFVENNSALAGEYNKKILQIDPANKKAKDTLTALKIKF